MRGTTVEDAYDLVLAAGTWAEPSRIDELWAGAKRIVACDGALQRCLRTGRSPDVVVGDMDSVEPDALAAFTATGGEVVVLDEQNSNDLAKALDWLEAKGTERCIVVGATGGDGQHEWANLLTCAASKMDIQCESNDRYHRFLRPCIDYSIDFYIDEEFSLFGLPEARGVDVTGAAYPLKDATLKMGSRGLHNVANKASVGLTFNEGRLMLMRSCLDSTEAETNEA